MDKNSVSYISSHSISVFAVGLFFGVLLDIIWPIKFLGEPLNQSLGLVIVILATFVIYWAEKHGHAYSLNHRASNVCHIDDMRRGPYRYTRNPKYLGLGLLLIGLGVILNSLFIVASALISAIVVNLYFIGKEEAILHDRHGELYQEYKNKVRKWL